MNIKRPDVLGKRAKTKSLTLAVLALIGAPLNAADEGRNFELSDRLKSSYDLGCIQTDELRPQYTPADMVKVVKACIQEGEFETAFQTFFVYTIYGGYDVEQIEDKTAKDAMSALNLRIFHSMDADQRKSFQAEAVKMADLESPYYQAACDIARSLGPPDYYPGYMISYGRRAFGTKFGEGLLKEFDESVAWQRVLEHLNGCSVE